MNVRAVAAAKKLRLAVLAGHGLTYVNVGPIAAVTGTAQSGTNSGRGAFARRSLPVPSSPRTNTEFCIRAASCTSWRTRIIGVDSPTMPNCGTSTSRG